MATKKKSPNKSASKKPKQIDGVVKPKKVKNPVESTAISDAIVDEPLLTEDAPETIAVSTSDTHITVLEADNEDNNFSEDITPAEGLNNESIAEPDVEEDLATEEPNTESAPEVSAAEISVAINNPAEEDLSDSNDDIESLIGDIEKEDEAAKSAGKAIAGIKDQEEEPTMNKKKAKSNKTANAKPFRIISRLLALATVGSLAALIVRVATTNILPIKYLALAIAVSAVFGIFYLFKAFRNKTRVPVLSILDVLGVVLIIGSIFGFLKIDETMRFLDENLNSNKEYSIYNVIVSKESNYNSLDSVTGKTFHSISDFVDTEKLESAVSEQVKGSVIYEDGITSLLRNSLDDVTYISLLNSGTYDAAVENDTEGTYEKGLKVIGEIKVEVEKSSKNSKSNLTEESFAIYISGIDTRSGMMVDRSLSDVNLIMTVNPKTRNILLVAIPRDYYVQLHGTSGLPDKLTHAGSLGGIDLSIATIEDLLDMEIDHYVRVNFNFVINLVDAVGGITVYSDVDYDIKAWTNPSCTFHPGNNTVDGACALAFARERYAYSSGDRHRGENQEQVIQKIFEKVTSSTTLISKYSDILNALSGSFESSISTSDITSLVNMQLNDMSTKWTMSTYNLNGTTGGAYTYSYPSQTLSVMFPDVSTVETAKAKIKSVLTGITEEPAVEDTESESSN